MKIEAPVKTVPSPRQGRNDSKYAEIYRQLDQLENGDWLPVVFNSRKEAYNFRLAAKTHRTHLFKAKMRGQTVYIQRG